jgi:hypothetical protein
MNEKSERVILFYFFNNETIEKNFKFLQNTIK